MGRFRIIRRQDNESWRIIMGGQKVLTEFSEATDMTYGSRYGVYYALLCRGGLSSMVVGGRFKFGIPKLA